MPLPIILLSSESGSGPTLLRLRSRLADEIGFYHSTTVSDTGDNGDAARVVIADEFRDDEIGYEHNAAVWLYAQNGAQAGVQRRIIAQPEAGYLGSMAAMQVSRPFTAALASGVTVELTSPLPVKRHLGIKGLNELLNEGLARIWTEVRLTITGNSTYSYSLAAYPWLQTYEQTRGIWDYRSGGTTNPSELSAAGYRLVKNGAGVSLVTNALYTSSETFELAVIVRADRYVSDGTTWAYTATPGLLGDAYQAACPEEWAIAFAMVKALQYLTRLVMKDKRLSKEEKAERLSDILPRRRTWALTAASILMDEMPQPIQEATTPLVVGAGDDSDFVESYEPSSLPLVS